ncbi:M15 family metallopeptidase [Vibrio tritonius]|uniref:M15 family metallopeptidase n=1 Tax=Vibrio tritonius TaxID=1435069 RepID=A0ABS7YGT3_9VIBR|nr:M15 family metallopeptidase [Vibrio tritonius]MCA2014880.1 M15 family metallopeptidase [Vibrio tritonius]
MTPAQLTGQSNEHLVEVLVGQKSFLMHPNVRDDLLALQAAAHNAGFLCHIASGFRPFERQLAIWNRKMSGETPLLDEFSQPLDSHKLSDEEKVWAILRWSALPGASRHHWGTDFDLFDRLAIPEGTTLQLEPDEYLEGHQQRFYLWLKDNAEQFGFFFPFQGKGNGVAFEPWHVSHRITANTCSMQFSLAILTAQIEQAPILGKEVILQRLQTIYTDYVTNISQ